MPIGWERQRRLTSNTAQNFLNSRLKKPSLPTTFSSYRRLKRDAELIQAGHMDSRLDELCNDIAMWVILYCSSVYTPFFLPPSLLELSGLLPPSVIPLDLTDSGKGKLQSGLVAGRGQ